MNKVAVRARQLGKQYRLCKAQGASYATLRDDLTTAFTAPLRGLASLLVRQRGQRADNAEQEDFWALKNVSFDIHPGEVVGIIGENGAGKTTLLKILSRITEPTEGEAEIRGRIGSLLEVGAGFHPELSGRENVYLNGVILGMKRAEVRRRFDAIVEFAEVQRFVDTPVKHYSSGMYLRLAFAVAAHLDTEVLMVDEVLAVGDARFQKKCLSKMQEVGSTGRTVLFVSHSMPAISRLCTRAILIEEGRVVQDGRSEDVVSAYLCGNSGTSAVREWPNAEEAPAGSFSRLRAVRVRSEEGSVTEWVDIRAVAVEMEYEVLESGHLLMPHFLFTNDEGTLIFSAHDLDPQWRRRTRPKGRYTSTAWIPGNLLSEGNLFVDAAMLTLEPVVKQFWAPNAVAFQVVDSPDGNTARGDWGGKMKGAVRPLLQWETQHEAIGPPTGPLDRECEPLLS